MAYVIGSIKDLVSLEVIDPIAEKPFISEVTPFRLGTSVLGLTPRQTVDRVITTPDLCLISSMFSMEWPITRLLIAEIRKRFPRCLIVGGGEHFSSTYEFSLLHSELDACVLGEGEQTARQLVWELCKEGRLPEGLAGTAVKSPDGKIIINQRRDRIKDLSHLPWPAWELFNVRGFLDRGVSNTGNALVKHRAMPIVATRGCPYQCTFCSNHHMWGSQWHYRQPADVLSEMEWLINQYQANHFDFCDLTAILKKSWIVDFCKQLLARGLNITWGLPSGTRAEALNEETLKLLKESGCNDLDYAPENGSSRMLKLIRKQVDLSKMLTSMKACHKTGIKTKANI
ncbi:MAG: B12-binding domain-containing radical SAM protein, partial [Deltaproteobacteria bacterium]|nr:B12-binding domain-containing radical SAM protein [Deltaproteobacteria bacterium]